MSEQQNLLNSYLSQGSFLITEERKSVCLVRWAYQLISKAQKKEYEGNEKKYDKSYHCWTFSPLIQKNNLYPPVEPSAFFIVVRRDWDGGSFTYGH